MQPWNLALFGIAAAADHLTCEHADANRIHHLASQDAHAMTSTRFRALPSPTRGFTLIEVMITVAIVAILASIALPNYRDYVLRGQLVDGTNGLSTMRATLERYFQDNRTYESVGAFTSPCDAAVQFGTFSVTCTVDATHYQLLATGSGATDGFVYFVDEKDVRKTDGVPSGWSTCATAWIVKRGQPCP